MAGSKYHVLLSVKDFKPLALEVVIHDSCVSLSNDDAPVEFTVEGAARVIWREEACLVV